MKQKEKSSPRQMVPDLRFPEFTTAGDWEQNKLGDLGTFLKGKGISKADLNEKGLTPCIRYGELYTVYGEIIDKVHSKTSLPASDLVLSVKNDVIVPSSGETKIDIAKASCVLHDNIALGGDLNIFRSNQNGKFISYLLNGPSKISISKLSQGDTVVHLYSSQLSLLSILIPSLSEQQKIADCLSSVDEVIQLETKKWESLKSYKKGLLQKLFPAEGETVPELRFPEFEGTGDWEERTLGEVFFEVPRPIEMDDEQIYSLVIVKRRYEGIISRGELLGKEIKVKTQFLIEENDFLISKRQIVHNACAVVKKDFEGSIVSNEYSVLRAKDDISIDFLEYFVKQPSVSKSFMDCSVGIVIEKMLFKLNRWFKEEFLFPTFPEQQKIADCISSLDALIQEQAERVEKLNSHKKGLLQGLFPVMGEERI